METEKGFNVGNFHKSFRVSLQKAMPVVLQPNQLQYLISLLPLLALLQKDACYVNAAVVRPRQQPKR